MYLLKIIAYIMILFAYLIGTVLMIRSNHDALVIPFMGLCLICMGALYL